MLFHNSFSSSCTYFKPYTTVYMHVVVFLFLTLSVERKEKKWFRMNVSLHDDGEINGMRRCVYAKREAWYSYSTPHLSLKQSACWKKHIITFFPGIFVVLFEFFFVLCKFRWWIEINFPLLFPYYLTMPLTIPLLP